MALAAHAQTSLS